MKIYTKKGDSGTTQLIGGTRVSKDHVRIEAYGTVDELNSYLGVVISYINEAELKEYLLRIQNELFNLGALLAADPRENKMVLPPVTDEDVTDMEKWIDRLEEGLPGLKNFILPGGSLAIAHSHVARCICRRAERCAVALDSAEPVEKVWLKYLNRLSDLLFVLARYLGNKEGVQEILWKSR